jgi:hypothetical protein
MADLRKLNYRLSQFSKQMLYLRCRRIIDQVSIVLSLSEEITEERGAVYLKFKQGVLNVEVFSPLCEDTEGCFVRVEGIAWEREFRQIDPLKDHFAYDIKEYLSDLEQNFPVTKSAFKL